MTLCVFEDAAEHSEVVCGVRSEGRPPDPLTNLNVSTAADDHASEKRADLQGFVLIRESVLLILRFGVHNDSVLRGWLYVFACSV